jgi:hypothetical protein
MIIPDLAVVYQEESVSGESTPIHEKYVDKNDLMA